MALGGNYAGGLPSALDLAGAYVRSFRNASPNLDFRGRSTRASSPCAPTSSSATWAASLLEGSYQDLQQRGVVDPASIEGPRSLRRLLALRGHPLPLAGGPRRLLAPPVPPDLRGHLAQPGGQIALPLGRCFLPPRHRALPRVRSGVVVQLHQLRRITEARAMKRSILGTALPGGARRRLHGLHVVPRRRAHHPRHPRPGLARRDHLPGPRRPLRQRRLGQRLQHRPHLARPLPRRRLAGDPGSPRLHPGPRRHRHLDLPRGQERRDRLRLRRLPRLLDPGLRLAQPPLRRRPRPPPHGGRVPRRRDQGHPRHRGQPRGPALLLRHQQDRGAGGEHLRRRLQQVGQPLRHAEPLPGLLQHQQHLPGPRWPVRRHGRQRVRPRVRLRRGRPVLHLARLLGPGADRLPERSGHQPHAAAAALLPEPRRVQPARRHRQLL